MKKQQQDRKEKKRLIRKLKKSYRLVIMSNENYEVKASVKLTPLNLLLLVSSGLLVFGALVFVLLLFTPVRNYLPGFEGREELHSQYLELYDRVDSLNEEAALGARYYHNIQLILNDSLPTGTETQNLKPVNADSIPMGSNSEQDSLLRLEMERLSGIGILKESERRPARLEEMPFFVPLKGVVTTPYNLSEGHLGIDVVSNERAPIKAVLNGRVIFSGWTSQDGHVITIQHDNNIVSFYKHADVLLKRMGDYVKAGDVVAISGNSGELSFGPHLHFELWYNQTAVNPELYMQFN